MPENQISRMALWAAYFRAFHARELGRGRPTDRSR